MEQRTISEGDLLTITLSIEQWRALLTQLAVEPESVGTATLVALANPGNGTGTHHRW